MPDFAAERKLGHHQGRIVVGLDEAGRGPLAGPVVAAAVWLEPTRCSRWLRRTLDDSKLVALEVREQLYGAIVQEAGWAVGVASVAEIDEINILWASMLAMERAYAGLGLVADHALIDGDRRPRNLPCDSTAVVGGDALSLSIAAASIVAKVTRDRLMDGLSESHPGYGWERNRGYGTAEHRAALLHLGVTTEHRRSYAPVRARLALTG